MSNKEADEGFFEKAKETISNTAESAKEKLNLGNKSKNYHESGPTQGEAVRRANHFVKNQGKMIV
jgi:hypothetical protein